MYPCIDCKDIFTSEYLLNKHKNRQTPCTVKIKCITCNKEFTRQIDLDRHMNRKFPCQPPAPAPVKTDLELRLEIEKEKTIRIKEQKEQELQSKLAILEKKAELEKEIIKEQTEKMEKKAEIDKEKADKKIAAEKEIIKETIEKEKERAELERQRVDKKLAAEKEIIKDKSIKAAEKSDRDLRIEQEKTKRKSNSLAIEKKNISEEKEKYIKDERRKAIESIKEYLVLESDIPDLPKSKSIRQYINHMFHYMAHNNLIDLYEILNNSESPDDMNMYMHTALLNNSEYPQYRRIFYFDTIQEYYLIDIKYNKEKDTSDKYIKLSSGEEVYKLMINAEDKFYNEHMFLIKKDTHFKLNNPVDTEKVEMFRKYSYDRDKINERIETVGLVKHILSIKNIPEKDEVDKLIEPENISEKEEALRTIVTNRIDQGYKLFVVKPDKKL